MLTGHFSYGLNPTSRIFLFGLFLFPRGGTCEIVVFSETDFTVISFIHLIGFADTMRLLCWCLIGCRLKRSPRSSESLCWLSNTVISFYIGGSLCYFWCHCFGVLPRFFAFVFVVWNLVMWPSSCKATELSSTLVCDIYNQEILLYNNQRNI